MLDFLILNWGRWLTKTEQLIDCGLISTVATWRWCIFEYIATYSFEPQLIKSLNVVHGVPTDRNKQGQ